jgi:hypothetical protein
MPIDEALENLPNTEYIAKDDVNRIGRDSFIGVLSYYRGDNFNLNAVSSDPIVLNKSVPIEYLDKTPAEFKDYMLSDEDIKNTLDLEGPKTYCIKKNKIARDRMSKRKSTKFQEHYKFCVAEFMDGNKIEFDIDGEQKIKLCYHIRKYSITPFFESNYVEIKYYINDHV